MKTKIICVLCCTVVAFLAATACGTSDGSTEKASSSNDVSSNETISVIDSELDNKLLENEKNVAGNGYIIINDENDYPAYVKDIRFFNNDHTKTLDFWGNQISEGNILGYTDALSPYRDENGNMGYVDLDGNIVIEPRFDNAYYFCNGTAEVSENGETFYIDINGEKTNNTKYQGYNGNIDNDSICGVFTGDYLVYINNNDNGEKTYGYADKNGNVTKFESCKLGSFLYGYAAVVESDGFGEVHIIDENFNTVADFKDDVLKNENSGFEITSDNIAFLKNEIDYICGFNYILPGGYFVFQESVYNSGKMKIVKIAPELYVTK